MNQPHSPGSRQIEDAFEIALSTYPDGRIAAVRPDGLFCPLPPDLPLCGQQPIDARAGIDVVAPEYKAMVLEQFRQLGETGASEVDVRLVGGEPARYALFDLTAAHGVVVLLLVPAAAGAAPEGPGILQGLAPARPRFGWVKRSEYGELIDADDGALGMLGYSREAFAALDTAESLHPEDYGLLIGHWFDLIGSETGRTRRVRVRYRRSDATWLWVELTLTRHLDHPEQPHMLSEMVDISEEMAAVDDAWRSRELLRRLTESLPVGVLQVDLSGHSSYSNDRLHEILGTQRDGALPAQFECLVAEDRPRAERLLQEAIDGGRDGELECRFRRTGSDETRYAKVTCRTLRDRHDAVSGALLCLSDETDSTLMRRELEKRATRDMLTQCLNRSALMDAMEQALALPADGTAVLYIDLDGFKPVNDRLGHAAGDQLLQMVAERLRNAVRDGDLIGRLGGDEFAILCPQVPTRELAREIAQRVYRALRFHATVGETTVRVGASIGAAWINGPGTPDRLLAEADQAMYRCKRTREGGPVLVACA